MKDGWLRPQELMGWLARQTKRRVLCLECGAGGGEIGHFMAGYFQSVLLLDQRPDLPAGHHPQVQRLQARAEEIPLRAGSVDLLISMQALHHFELERHLSEAKRLLRPGGVFAALSWSSLRLPEPVAKAYAPTFRSLDPYWEPERPWVISGYAGTRFPGMPLNLPRAAMRKRGCQDGLDAIIAAWSATQRALQLDAEIEDPDPSRLAAIPADDFDLVWPIVGIAFCRP